MLRETKEELEISNLKKRTTTVRVKKKSEESFLSSKEEALQESKDIISEAENLVTDSNSLNTLGSNKLSKFLNKEGQLYINDFYDMPFVDLKNIVEELNKGQSYIGVKKTELIFVLAKICSDLQIEVIFRGILEVLSDGYGFLRTPSNSYLAGNNDVYVSPSQIRLFNLKTGDIIKGQIRSPRDNERFFAMLKIKTINDDDPSYAQTRISFDNLTPLYPNSRINLEYDSEDLCTRIINLFSPIGRGQRALIVSPPKAGKTTLLQKIANAITINCPDVILMVLLINERPEEVTDMIRNVNGEVIASTFDEQASKHIQVAEMVLEKAKRLVEHKKDVVILLDSITRLARAYNQTMPSSGKILSGGIDANTLHKPKRFFGAARNIEEGGSLTIIATALVDTGSKMDDVIFEEFKSTGNMEVNLDRNLAERRIFPAINIKKSGTRKEDLLLTKEEMSKVLLLRKIINNMDDAEAVEALLEKIKKTKTNEVFLKTLSN